VTLQLKLTITERRLTMKNLLKTLFFLFAVVSLCTQPAAAAGIMDKIISEKKLKVGVAPWPKLINWDPKTNQYEGIIADDLRNFEKLTGIKIEYTNTTWDGMIAGLQAGKWDAVSCGLSPSIERSLVVTFTNPYGWFNGVALIRKDDSAKTFQDLDKPGNIITVVGGSSWEKFYKDKFQNAKVASFGDAGMALMELIQGKAKAYVGDSIVNSTRAKERPELKLLEFSPQYTRWTPHTHAVRYSDLDLLQFLNTYIFIMQTAGWYKELAEKYEMPESWYQGPPK
jgi:polar amino acid transport system substrate-binding protein